MKHMLITAFEPFGGETVNPSERAVFALPDTVGEFRLSRLCIPVTFGEAADCVIRAAEALHPDVILCIGQAGSRDAVTPELVGINLRYASIPDNGGAEPRDEPIASGGETAYFSTIPVRAVSEAIRASGIPSRVSYSAGAYVCNDVLYTLLRAYHGTKTQVGFIHVPYMKEQGKEPSMELSDIVKALTAAITCIGEGVEGK